MKSEDGNPEELKNNSPHELDLLDPKSEKRWRALSDEVVDSRKKKSYAGLSQKLLAESAQNREVPSSPAFVLWNADNLVNEGNFELAIREYDNCISKAQNVRPFIRGLDFISSSLTHKSELLNLTGAYKQSLNSYRELYDYNRADKNAALRAGLIAEKIGDKDLALALYGCISSEEYTVNTGDPSQLAKRAVARLNEIDVTYFLTESDLASKLVDALQSAEIKTLAKLISKTHFTIGPVGGHTSFEKLELLEDFFTDLKTSPVQISKKLLGSGGKKYLPTSGWKGKRFVGEVALILNQAPSGWQWTGIALSVSNAFWKERWKPSIHEKNDPLPFELRAPWPRGQCFTAGGFEEYIFEQIWVLATLVQGPAAVLLASENCCGWGPRGFYYNTANHSGQNAFGIDFTRYRRFVPYDNESGGTPVLSVYPGVVRKVQGMYRSGDPSSENFVFISHADPDNPTDTSRYTSTYYHLEGPAKLMVSAGMSLRTGTRLGYMDDTGNSILDHLHFSIHDKNLIQPNDQMDGIGKSVRPAPMSGVWLGDGASNTCVTSNNSEYTGTNQMINPKSYVSQHWVITPVSLAFNETAPSSVSEQKWLLVLTGVAVLELKGNGPEWLHETVALQPKIHGALNHAVEKFGIPRPPARDYELLFETEHWAPHVTLNSIFNKNQSVNSGFAVDSWSTKFQSRREITTGNEIIKCYKGVEVEVAVSDIDAYIARVSYHITLQGKIRFGRPTGHTHQ
jgi:hypothetical protein